MVSLITFDTTHMALWAEEIARDGGVPSEVVPAPPGIHARCDLALSVRTADLARFYPMLDESGVEYYAAEGAAS